MAIYLLDFDTGKYKIFPLSRAAFPAEEKESSVSDVTMWKMLIAERWDFKKALMSHSIDQARQEIRGWCRRARVYDVLIETNSSGDVVAIAPEGRLPISVTITKNAIGEALALESQSRAYYYDHEVRANVDSQLQQRFVDALTDRARGSRDSNFKKIAAKFLKKFNAGYQGKDQYFSCNKEILKSIVSGMRSIFFDKSNVFKTSAERDMDREIKQYFYQLIMLNDDHSPGDVAIPDTIK